MRIGNIAPTGQVTLKVSRAPKPGAHGFLTHALPRPGLGREINLWRARNLPRVLRQALKVAIACQLARWGGVMTAYGRLSLKVMRNGETVDLGIASYRVVTDAGVGYIVDAFQNSTELENMKYHGFGEDNTAEDASDTGLVAELSTEYETNSTRPTGSTTEGATANIYKTVGTLDPDDDVAIEEHGVFSQASTAGGVLLDRSVFATVNLAGSGDTLQVTYELTLAAGS